MKGDTLSIKGYSVEELPNLKTRAWALYRHKDGRVVRLPADPIALHYYQRKGLVLLDEPLQEN